MKSTHKRTFPINPIPIMLIGAVLLAVSFWPIYMADTKLSGNLLQLAGTCGLALGLFFVIQPLARRPLTMVLFLLGWGLVVFARVFDFLGEIPSISAYVLADDGATTNAIIEHGAETLGGTLLLFGMVALFVEMAKFREEAERNHQRYVDTVEASFFLARVADMAAAPVLGADRDGTIRTWNRGASALFGYTVEEALGRPLSDFLQHEQDEGTLDVSALLGEADAVHDLELLGIGKDGTQFAAAATVARVANYAGETLGASIVVRDIEHLKKERRELIAARNLLAGALQSIEVGLFVLDTDVQIVEYNPSMAALTGFTLEDLEHRHYSEIFAHLFGADSPIASELVERLLGKGEQLQYRNLQLNTKEGEQRIANIAVSPVFDRDGQIIAAAGAAIDVTEREALEAQLLASRKMESLGRMAGGIAHDFNNILGGVLGYASLLREKLEHPEYIRYLEAVEDSARRASELTHQLLAFAKGAERQIEPVALDPLLLDTIDLFSHSLNPNIRIEHRLNGHSPIVHADASQLKQVFMNLFVNARDAIDGAGVITVSSDCVRPEEMTHFADRTPRSGDYARVTVTDTGRGMTPEVYQRIFEPFFSTKDHGRGYGLGLSVVYGVVTAHDGVIDIQSEPGTGTAIDVYLPTTEQEPVVEEKRLLGDQFAKGNETIMVVDDEQLIRLLATDVLGSCGYNVLLASEGAEAVDVLRQNGDEVALVVLDLLMPGMNGMETLVALREIQPELPCIFSSGYGSDTLDERFKQDPHVRIVPKPFEARHLAATIRELLDHKQRP